MCRTEKINLTLVSPIGKDDRSARSSARLRGMDTLCYRDASIPFAYRPYSSTRASAHRTPRVSAQSCLGSQLRSEDPEQKSKQWVFVFEKLITPVFPNQPSMFANKHKCASRFSGWARDFNSLFELIINHTSLASVGSLITAWWPLFI